MKELDFGFIKSDDAGHVKNLKKRQALIYLHKVFIVNSNKFKGETCKF